MGWELTDNLYWASGIYGLVVPGGGSGNVAGGGFLFTTLTGMSCGVLLNMKYHLLDWSVDGLMDDVREQTYLLRGK